MSPRIAACLLALALVVPLAEASAELEPTYEPRPPPEEEVYTTKYLFAVTRAVADSTLVPAAQVPAGAHEVVIELEGAGERRVPIEVERGGYAAVVVTEPR